MTKRGLLIDIDGVLVVSWQPLPGAVNGFARLHSAGVPMRLLTNTTSRPRADIARSLRESGFDVADDEISTAASATASYLAQHHPGARCVMLNSGDVDTDLGDVNLVEPDTPAEDVDVVILGGAGPEFSYTALNHALEFLLAGAALVAMHRNLLWRTKAGMQLDTGAYLVGLERAAGVDAAIMGKPAPAMFESALTDLGLGPTEVAMVGDDIDTDVRAAQALGITGLQVRTGKFRESQLHEGPRPDAIVETFADVPGWWATNT